MDAAFKRNLIELVRLNDCVYNPKNKHYKNMAHKLLIWEEIGRTLGVEGAKAKEAWRSLRDGYVRYTNPKGLKRKYSRYAWSEELKFLDECIEWRQANRDVIMTSSNQDRDSPDTDSNSQVFHQAKPFSPSQSPNPNETVWIQTSLTDNSSRFTSEPVYTEIPIIKPSCTKTLESMPEKKLTQTEKKEKFTDITKNNRPLEGVDKVLDYLKTKNKKRREMDDVDHLFASYAKSFKKLPLRSQVDMKLRLAQLFADAEMIALEKRQNDDEIQSEKYFSSTDSEVEQINELKTATESTQLETTNVQIKTEIQDLEMTENNQNCDGFENNVGNIKIEIETDYQPADTE